MVTSKSIKDAFSAEQARQEGISKMRNVLMDEMLRIADAAGGTLTTFAVKNGGLTLVFARGRARLDFCIEGHISVFGMVCALANESLESEVFERKLFDLPESRAFIKHVIFVSKEFGQIPALELDDETCEECYGNEDCCGGYCPGCGLVG